MTHVVTDSCIQCRYTDCVEICPVDCFHEGLNFITIDPEECIDCGLCVSECPVNAIKAENELRPNERHFIKINQELSSKWPVINVKKQALPTAQEFKDKTNKLSLLIKT